MDISFANITLAAYSVQRRDKPAPARQQTIPTVDASDALAARTLTITVASLTGDPAPSAALTALTLDGVDVLDDATGTGPWSYAVPSSGANQAVLWEVTATNSEGSDVAAGLEVVPADLFVPAQMTAPTLIGDVGEATLTLASDPANGGSATAARDYEITLSSDPTFLSPFAQGQTSTAEEVITVSPLSAGDYIARSRARNSVGAGAWSTASPAATVTAATAGDLSGLKIVANRTSVIGGEGVVFRVAGPNDTGGLTEAQLRAVECYWDFGASEAYDFVSPDPEFRGDRNARYAQGTVVGHVFLNSTGANVTRTVSLTAILPDGTANTVSLGQTGQPPVVTVADPDVTYRLRTAWVGRSDLYADVAAFRTAARAGTVTGIDATEATQAPDDFFSLDYAKDVSGTSVGALYDWRSNSGDGLAYQAANGASGTAVAKRILLQRGGVWPWEKPGNFGYSPRYIEAVGAFGSTSDARPRFETAAPTTSTSSNVEGSFFLFAGDTQIPARFMASDIDFIGTYDPANPNRSDLGTHDYGSEADLFNPDALAAAAGFPVTLFRIKTRGLNKAVSSGGLSKNIVIADLDIGDWNDYGVISSFEDSALVGSRLKQPLDTQFNPPGVKNRKDNNPDEHPNWSKHGALRTGDVFHFGVHQNDMRQRGGWTDGRQPVIRAGTGTITTIPGDVSGYDGDAIGYAALLYSQNRRYHMSIAGNHMDGNNIAITFNQQNENGFTLPPLLMLSQANYMEGNRVPGGTASYGFLSASHGNIVSRSDYFYAPNWIGDAGNFLIVGDGSAPATAFVPDFDPADGMDAALTKLGGVQVVNPTIVSRIQGADGSVTLQSAPLYYRTMREPARVRDHGDYSPHYKQLHALARAYATQEAITDPTPTDINTIIENGSSGWTAWQSWVDTHWADLVDDANMNVRIGFRRDDQVVITNPLYVFGDSTITVPTAYATPAGANLSALYQPQAGSSILAAGTSSPVARRDFRGTARPSTPARGALEQATDLSGWPALPVYAAPTITPRFEDGDGDPYTPQDGDVFGTDFFAGVNIDTPGTPALMKADLDLVVERDVAGQWAALSAGDVVAPLNSLRVVGRYAYHPAGGVEETALVTIPSASDTFSASAVQFDSANLALPDLGTTRAFTFAVALRPTVNTSVQNVLAHASNGSPELRLGAKNPTSGNAAWFVEPNFTGSSNPQRFVAGDYHNVGEPEFIVFTGSFDASNLATFEIWRNGVRILQETRQGGPTSTFGFDGVIFGTLRADVSRFVWLKLGAALDGAAATAALFDLNANAARDLGASGEIDVGGAQAPTFYIHGDATAWNNGTAATRQTYTMNGVVKMAP